jgi:hypothetical protein
MIIYKELPGFKRPTARGRALVRARALALCGMKVNIFLSLAHARAHEMPNSKPLYPEL